MEDFKVVEEEEEEGLVEAVEKLFVITVAKLDILHVTVRTQHICLSNIVDNSIM